jgi:hypothetical protein
MERAEMERCLEQVAAYRASGQKAKVWAEANGVALRELASWCAHAERWRARLAGVVPVPAAPKPGGFVAAHVPPAPAGTVRVELHAGTTRVELHWPLVHTRELAAWLREVGR